MVFNFCVPISGLFHKVNLMTLGPESASDFTQDNLDYFVRVDMSWTSKKIIVHPIFV